MPACPSFRPSACNNSAPTRRIFMKFDSWNIFSKICLINSSFFKSSKNNGYFIWECNVHFLSCIPHFFLEREMFRTKRVVEEIKTHILCSVTLALKIHMTIISSFVCSEIRENWIIKTIHTSTVNHQKTQRFHNPPPPALALRPSSGSWPLLTGLRDHIHWTRHTR